MSGTRRKPGQLGPQVEGYRAWLAQRGYTPQTVRNMLTDLGQVGRWMSGEGLEPAQLDEDAMAAFLAARQAAGRRRALGPRAMMPLLSYLREAGVTPAAKPPQTPLGALLGEYRVWLVQERGLAAATVLRYENTARRFLQQQAMTGGVLEPAGLTGADVNAFLLRECGRVSAGSAKGRVAELRSVLRFLYLQGITPLRLGTAVPPVGGWRLATLPPTMTAADVQLLLDSCDRSSRRRRPRLRDHDAGRAAGPAVDRGRAPGTAATSTGGRVSSSSAGRRAARTGSRCRRRSVRPWSPTCPAAGRLQVPGGCS